MQDLLARFGGLALEPVAFLLCAAQLTVAGAQFIALDRVAYAQVVDGCDGAGGVSAVAGCVWVSAWDGWTHRRAGVGEDCLWDARAWTGGRGVVVWRGCWWVFVGGSDVAGA